MEQRDGPRRDLAGNRRRAGHDASTTTTTCCEDAARGQLLSLDEYVEEHDGEPRLAAAGQHHARARASSSGAFRQALGDAIEHLPEREQLVLSLYYEQEMNLREIGAVLNVSESRVCQIHGQAMLRLRSRLTDWRSEMDAEMA